MYMIDVESFPLIKASVVSKHMAKVVTVWELLFVCGAGKMSQKLEQIQLQVSLRHVTAGA